MVNRMQFYIDGAWSIPSSRNPRLSSTRRPKRRMYEVALAPRPTSTKAVAAARRASRRFRRQREERVALLGKIIGGLQDGMRISAPPVSDEMERRWPMAETAGRRRPRPSRRHDGVLKTITFEEQLPLAVVCASRRRRRHDTSVETAAEPAHLQGRARRSPPAAL